MARSFEAARLGAELTYSATGSSLYDRDMYSWALEQARLVRDGHFAELDRENVAEEIESLGRGARNSVESFLALVIQHMLKWDYQPARRTQTWIVSIKTHRLQFRRGLKKNPGLKGEVTDILEEAYEYAVGLVEAETGLGSKDLPARCPYDLTELLERPFALSDIGED